MNHLSDLVMMMERGKTSNGRAVGQIISMRNELNIVNANHIDIAKELNACDGTKIGSSSVLKSLNHLESSDQIRFMKDGFIINPETIPAKNKEAALKAWAEA